MLSALVLLARSCARSGKLPAGYYASAMSANLAYHKQIGAPFKHWQLDSWWYPKGDGGVGSSQPHSAGVFEWVADPFVFPKGISGLQAEIQLPFVMHNRWYSPGCGNFDIIMTHHFGGPILHAVLHDRPTPRATCSTSCPRSSDAD